MHLLDRINTDTALKMSGCLLAVISDFRIIDYLSIAIHDFTKRVLISVSLDEIATSKVQTKP